MSSLQAAVIVSFSLCRRKRALLPSRLGLFDAPFERVDADWRKYVGNGARRNCDRWERFRRKFACRR